MRQWMRVSAVIIAAVAMVACGKSESQKQVEEAAKQMEQAGKEMAKAGEEMAKAGEAAGGDFAKAGQAFANAMQQMAGAGGDQKPVDPVSFKELQTVLPAVGGWEMGKPTGERMSAPVPFSKTEVDYTKGEANVNVEITDSGFNRLVFAPFMMMMAAGYEKETDSGYEKSTKIGGNPGLEKWNSQDKDGEITVLVANRFIVKFEGNGLDDIKSLQAFVAATDMSKLAGLK